MRTIEEELMLKRQQLEEKELEDSKGYVRLPSFSLWLIAAAILIPLAGLAIFMFVQF